MVSKKRKFKLAFPLKFERKGSQLLIIDNFANDNVIKLDKLDTFEIKSIDSDGFALFEVLYSHKSIGVSLGAGISLPQAEASVNGYTLFHSSVPKSTSYGHIKSNYEYYKRNRDLSYYALIKKESMKPTKIILGSMFNPETRILQFMKIIYQSFNMDQSFDRKTLSHFLPSPLNNNRIMKCVFDILTYEKFLLRDEAPPSGRRGKGRKREIFRKTKKLVDFMINPRSFQKPNGASVGQLDLTSD